MTNRFLVDVVDNLNLPSNKDNQRLKPHTLRAIYAISMEIKLQQIPIYLSLLKRYYVIRAIQQLSDIKLFH